MRGRMAQVIVPRPKGLPTTCELDASSTTTGMAGHQRRASNGGTTRSRAAPAPCAVAPVPQPVKFWLWLLTCWVDAGLGGSGLPAGAQARPTPAFLRAGSPDRRGGPGDPRERDDLEQAPAHRDPIAATDHSASTDPLPTATGSWHRAARPAVRILVRSPNSATRITVKLVAATRQNLIRLPLTPM